MMFVGRDTELDLLAREAALALDLSTGRSIFLHGPAGAGKTALAAEFLARLHAERPGLAIGRGRCLQTLGSADPYLPFVDALRDLSDEATAGFVQKETLSQLITELAPYWLSVVPMVGGLLSAGFATAARLRGGAPPGAAPSREALFVQYLELVRRLAQQAPLVLLLDDLQWADQSSVALLHHVTRGIEALPVLIVCTLRHDEAEAQKHPVTELVRELEREGIGRGMGLGELPEADLDRLLAAELEGDVSEPLRRWVSQTAGGNPLFASELVRLLRQSGAAVEVRGEWQLTGAAGELEVPRSAEAVIESRIQQLAPEQVRLLQYASVEGNNFNSVILAGLLEQDELDVLDALEVLERRHKLIRTRGELELPDGEVATTLEFSHALAQTVLYRQVLGKRRILLHRKAGELLERAFGAAAERVAGQLAWHFHQGRMAEPAYRYAGEAADAARRVYAHWEAEEFYRIALEHAPGDAERAALQERLGDVYQTVGYYDRGIACYAACLELLPQDGLARLRLRRKTAGLEARAGLAPGPTLLGRLRGLQREAEQLAGADEEHCRILLEISNLPHTVDSVRTAEAAVSIAETVRDPPLLAQALEQLSALMIFGGAPQEALPQLERAMEVSGGAHDPLRAARYYNVLGIAHAKLGQYRQALGSFERMLEMSERMANAHFIGSACSNLGAALLYVGDYHRAEEVLQRARIINERRDRSTLAQSLLNLAKRAHWAGDLALARERYAALLECAREFEHWRSEAAAYGGLGLCALETGRPEDARAAAEAACAVLAERTEWFEDREFVEILLAYLEAADGRVEAADRRLERASAALAEADLFAWAQVGVERVKILQAAAPETARELLAELVVATRGVEFALDGEIETLRDALLQERAVPAPPAVP